MLSFECDGQTISVTSSRFSLFGGPPHEKRSLGALLTAEGNHQLQAYPTHHKSRRNQRVDEERGKLHHREILKL